MLFGKIKIVTEHQEGEGVERAGQCHQMTHRGGRGSKISLKSVTYYLNGPLNMHT